MESRAERVAREQERDMAEKLNRRLWNSLNASSLVFVFLVVNNPITTLVKAGLATDCLAFLLGFTSFICNIYNDYNPKMISVRNLRGLFIIINYFIWVSYSVALVSRIVKEEIMGPLLGTMISIPPTFWLMCVLYKKIKSSCFSKDQIPTATQDC